MDYKYSDFENDFDEEEDYIEREGEDVFLYALAFAKGGDITNIRALGDCYSGHGYGVKHDINKAVFWYLKAAEKDDFYSQWRLGDIFSLGRYDIEPDYPRALYWYERAAAQGVEYAQKRVEELKKELQDKKV